MFNNKYVFIPTGDKTIRESRLLLSLNIQYCPGQADNKQTINEMVVSNTVWNKKFQVEQLLLGVTTEAEFIGIQNWVDREQ